MTSRYKLPGKIQSIMNRLRIEYSRENNRMLYDIIDNASVFVRKEVDYDNWNGGTTGHGVVLFLPISIIERISLNEQKVLCEKICQHMNICANKIENEFIAYVATELIDEDDEEYQNSIAKNALQIVDPAKLTIWNKKQIRLFISHRDNQKKGAKALGESLVNYGISSFVAHDTIEPMTTWQNEIIKGLLSMEAMLLYIDDGFYDSIWTNQEVGFALGRGIPIIPVKLQQKDPMGFILKDIQAVRGNIENANGLADAVYPFIRKVFGNDVRLREALIYAFISSTDFNEARERFLCMNRVIETLSEDEIQALLNGFQENSQLHNAIYLTNNYNRFLNFLTRCTSMRFEISSNDKRIINKIKNHPLQDESIPF